MNHLYLLCLAFFLLSGCEDKPEPVKPNIIVIMADDLGYGGISCYGSKKVSTPNLDALAANGVRFSDFHSNGPVCSPTRAALLTGNYQQRAGLEGVIYVRGETRALGLDTSRVTVAKLLKKNGYATGIMGKWHLGYRKEFNPVNHGFDEFYGYVSGNIDYHSHYDNAGIYDWWHNLDSIAEEGYSTDLITRHSVDFINQHKEGPFFLYVAHEAPHAPLQGRDDPAFRLPGKKFDYYGRTEDRQDVYREMVEVMDEGIGKIMQALIENNLEENTLVIFMSDNGAEAFGDNGGLNGHKGQLLEGGHRVPAIACWKHRIVPRESGATLATMDLTPTILAVSKTQVPAGLEFDGTDFSNVLFDGSDIPDRTLFWRYRNEKAARRNQWKLIITGPDTALYNLEQDIRETADVSGSNKKVVETLTRELERWETDVGQIMEMKTR